MQSRRLRGGLFSGLGNPLGSKYPADVATLSRKTSAKREQNDKQDVNNTLHLNEFIPAFQHG